VAGVLGLADPHNSHITVLLISHRPSRCQPCALRGGNPV